MLKENHEELCFLVDNIFQVLQRNKVGNYSVLALKLLAYIIVIAGRKNTVFIDFENRWINENFKIMNFKRCLGFLKQKDIVQTLVSKDNYYKFNNKLISNLIDKNMKISMFWELRTHLEEQFAIEYKKKMNKRKQSEEELLEEITEEEIQQGSTKAFIVGNIKNKKGRKIRKDSTELYGKFNLNPSENPKLQSWKTRKVEDFRAIDYLGYYICCYKEETGYENISLQNDQAYTKAKLQITKILDKWFGKDKEKLKQYIAWAVNYFTHSRKDNFTPSIDVILNPYKIWPFEIWQKQHAKKNGLPESKWAKADSWKRKEK